MGQPSYAVLSIIALAAGCAKGSSGGLVPDGDDVEIDAPVTPAIDAAPPPPIDAAEIVPDAEVIPDANPIAPDASCSTTTQQILLNGGFDLNPKGVNWTQLPQDPTYPPIVDDAEMPSTLDPQSGAGTRAVWLGGLYSSTDSLYQQIAIPAGTQSLSITGYKLFTSLETVDNRDFLRIQILNTADVVLETVIQYDNPTTDDDTTWVPITLPVAGAYPGQTIRLRMQSTCDADPTPGDPTDSAGNTNFFLDTFTLTATVETCL